MNIEQFLQTEGIEPDHVIYNMMNIKKPKVDIVRLLENFKKQLLIHSVSQQSELVCKHKFGDSYEQMGGGLTLHECEKCGIVQTCG